MVRGDFFVLVSVFKEKHFVFYYLNRMVAIIPRCPYIVKKFLYSLCLLSIFCVCYSVWSWSLSSYCPASFSFFLFSSFSLPPFPFYCFLFWLVRAIYFHKMRWENILNFCLGEGFIKFVLFLISQHVWYLGLRFWKNFFLHSHFFWYIQVNYFLGEVW